MAEREGGGPVELGRGGRGAVELDRIAYFSDAVIAIAITLMAAALAAPDVPVPELGPALLALWPDFLAFLLSFWVIAQHWTAHHRMFRLLQGWDGPLGALSMLFLLTVVLLPFSTELLGHYIDALPPPVVVIYTVNLMACGITLALLWRHIIRAGLLLPTVDARVAGWLRRRALAVPGVESLAIPWVFLHRGTAWIPWVLAAVVSRLLEIRPRSRPA